MSAASSQSSLSSQSFANQASLAMSQGQSTGATSLGASASPETARKAAEQFSGMFMSQMFSHMFDSVGTDSMFGGGQGEEMFRSVLVDEYGKAAAKSSTGTGLTDNIMHTLIAQQEVKS